MDKIFQAYLDDKCPVCGLPVDADNPKSYTETNGKCVAKTFECDFCGSQYVVGFERACNPIKSSFIYQAERGE